MQLRIGRAGLLLLVALFAADWTTTVEAATRTQKSGGTTVQRTAQRTAKKRPVAKKKRRARRPPPGGVYARHAIVLDPATGKVLFEKNAARSVPIASLTKLMTALVFLEQKPEEERSVDVRRDEIRGGGHTRLRRGELVRLGDLLHMSLMCSDNVATRVLVRESGLPSAEFLARMNQKAHELGMEDSRFVEFTGLDEHNVSSAADIARLLRAASDNDRIRDISTKRYYDFRSDAYPHRVVNTNRLLYNRRMEILGGKTGFISEAGYCLATWIRTGGRDLIAVVLGAPTNATRFADVIRLVQRTVDAPARTQT